jgi:hypothetical protein
MEKIGKRPKPPPFSTTLPTPSTSTPTPDSNDGRGDTSVVSMSVEEVMDMDPETDVENDEMVDGEGAAGKLSGMPPPTHSPWTAHDTNFMDLEESFHSRLTTVPSDPRRRAPPDS